MDRVGLGFNPVGILLAEFTSSGNPGNEPNGVPAQAGMSVPDGSGGFWSCTVSYEPPTGATWVHLVTGGSSGFPIWIYGDGSDGPIAFTASPRTVTDAVTAPGSDVITSETADFTDADIGLVLDDSGGLDSIPHGARIKSITNGTTAIMTSVAASDAGSANTVIIGGTVFQPGSYSSITIPTGATAVPAPTPYPDFGGYCCSGEYYIDGTLDLRGVNVNGGVSQNLGTSGIGASGSGDWPPISGSGGSGAIGAGGTTSPRQGNASGNFARQPMGLLSGVTAGGNNIENGGGAGAGDGTNNGGDGGNAGLVWVIAAKTVVHGTDALYELVGQAGGAGAEGGNCGGGGGGADGWWITVSDSLTGSPALTGGGGAGGAGTGTGEDGTPGQAGFGVHYTPDAVTVQTP